jgi:hypothetical protein
VATVVVNTPNHIEFKNILATQPPDDAPTVSAQAGDWDAGSHTETGIVIDVYGAQAPLLSAADARKLSKWLARAADDLDGTRKKQAKHKNRHYEEDDTNSY